MARRKFSKLKSLIYERETTQEELATLMEKSKGYLSRRLNAKEPFNTEDIKMLSNELKIPQTEWVEYFFEG